LRFFYCVFLIHLHSPVFDLLRFAFLFKFLVVMAQLKLLANFQFKLWWKSFKVYHIGQKGPRLYYSLFCPIFWSS
jgi:hypothetical protein